MKLFLKLAVFCLCVGAIGCGLGFSDHSGGFGGGGGKPIVIDLMSPEQHFRADLETTWLTCQPFQDPKDNVKKSVQYELQIHGDSADLNGHIHSDTACASKDYESYQIGHYAFGQIKAADRYRGTAHVDLRIYYPAGFALGTNFAIFDNEPLAEAVVGLIMSANSTHLQMSLSSILISTHPVSQTAVLDFSKSEKTLIFKIGAVDITGWWSDEAEKHFPTEEQLVDWVKTAGATVVSAKCIANYFGNTGVDPVPMFGPVTRHADWAPKGYHAHDVDVHFLPPKTGATVNDVVFDIVYLDKDNKEEDASFICPLTARPAGIAY